LFLYLLGWLPVLGLLTVVSAAAGGVPPGTAAAPLGPACLIFAFTCLTPWYLCRIWPLRLAGRPGFLVTHLGAAAAASGVLSGSAALAGFLLEKPAPAPGPVFAIGLLVYGLSLGLHFTALAAESSREAERRSAESRTLAREAELQALRMQLNPHFLFNSLHSIAALATLDGGRAREMCVRLADFLRNSLRLGSRENIPLSEELALARNYLDVERVRFGDRLQVYEEIEPECQECGVPALLLQPLVENAVKHGIAGLVEGGSIRLAAKRQNGVSITLENPFDPDVRAGSTGLGLAHVRRRLAMRYGEDASVEARAEGSLYRVVLRLPCESPMASSSRA
jgi:two-component system sensor histidine kinase AlgZ